MVIDFYTETFGPLVPDVVNTIYFQAWASYERADVFEFVEASLKVDRDDNMTLVLIEEKVKTSHRGKGSFKYLHSERYKRVYIEFISQPSDEVVTRDVFLNQFYYFYPADPSQSKPVIYNQNNEVTFSVINPNKIVAPFGDANAGVVNLKF